MAPLDTPNFPRDQPARDRAFATLKAMLGEDRLEAIRDLGRTLSFEQAVAEVSAAAEHIRSRD